MTGNLFRSSACDTLSLGISAMRSSGAGFSNGLNLGLFESFSVSEPLGFGFFASAGQYRSWNWTCQTRGEIVEDQDKQVFPSGF